MTAAVDPPGAAAPGLARSGCRGWPLVAAIGRLTPAEREAADAHLRLCRHCRHRLRADAVLARRVAAGGSATVGAGIAGAAARLLGSGAAGGSFAGPLGALPVIGAIAGGLLATGVGGVVVATQRHAHPAPAQHPTVNRPAAHHPAAPVAVRTTPPDGAATGDPAGSPNDAPTDVPALVGPAGPATSPTGAPAVPLGPVASLTPLPAVSSVLDGATSLLPTPGPVLSSATSLLPTPSSVLPTSTSLLHVVPTTTPLPSLPLP